MQLIPFQICQVHRWDGGAAAAQLRATEAIALDEANRILCLDAGRLQYSLYRIEEAAMIATAHAPLVFQPKPQWGLALFVDERVSKRSIRPFGQDCRNCQGHCRLSGEHVA